MAINRNFNLDELLNVLTVDNTDKNEKELTSGDSIFSFGTKI